MEALDLRCDGISTVRQEIFDVDKMTIVVAFELGRTDNWISTHPNIEPG